MLCLRPVYISAKLCILWSQKRVPWMVVMTELVASHSRSTAVRWCLREQPDKWMECRQVRWKSRNSSWEMWDSPIHGTFFFGLSTDVHKHCKSHRVHMCILGLGLTNKIYRQHKRPVIELRNRWGQLLPNNQIGPNVLGGGGLTETR